MAKKKKNSLSRILVYLLLIAALVIAFLAWKYYARVFDANISLKDKESYIYIRSDYKLNDIANYLYVEDILNDTTSFLWMARKKNYQGNNIHPGRYLIKNRMNNNELINLLRSGKQQPVKLTFNSIRSKEELAGEIGQKLEVDSANFLQLLNDETVAAKYSFNKENFISMFLPNTYEFYWDTDSEEFIQRMAKEYKTFWNAERIAKANNLGLSQSEVSIMASIVQAEQLTHADERPRIAGLYINRLKMGMPLQSDPTIIYALNDFSIKRVLNKDKSIDSKYNTYKYRGLPPGPINLPELSSIDAVLNYEKHNYIYMCAKADFSGYHDFSTNLRQHNNYAAKYRKELNKRKIMR